MAGAAATILFHEMDAAVEEAEQQSSSTPCPRCAGPPRLLTLGRGGGKEVNFSLA